MMKKAQHNAALMGGQSVLVSRKLVMDGATPVALFSHLRADQPYAFLLESVTGGDKKGRYSILALQPDRLWVCKDGAAQLFDVDDHHQRSEIASDNTLKPLQLLELQIAQSQMQLPDHYPPMVAGWIGMMGYEMVRELEHLPSDKEGPSDFPDGCFMRPKIMIVHDNATDQLTLASPIWNDASLSQKEAEAAILAANQRIDRLIDSLQTLKALAPVAVSDSAQPIEFNGNMSANQYRNIVEKCKEAIRAGEVFQIVPSMRFTADFTHSPLAFYRALRHLNPSPFLFYLQLDNSTIIGSSPEILVRLRDDQVTIRPLAGTRKRGATIAEDVALAEDLLNDTKELAEHLMLLDLGRNDVGRVTQGGSVKVTERMVIERYSHVMHIVSNVQGVIAPNTTALSALMAGFPAGTVTGAPKIRAMEILDQLEPDRRGFYGGCVGYFAPNGEMDSCITLRTALIKQGQLHLQAGAGVVADSDPQSEYEEVCNKARALMRAAQITECFE